MNGHINRPMLLACLLLLVTACGRHSRQDASASAPGVLVDHFEQRLLSADSVRVRFSISSSGSVVSVFQGSLSARRTGDVTCTAEGAFMGSDAAPHLAADSRHLLVGADTLPRPADLEGTMLLGLVRMGLLHNLARLTMGNPPDHTDGGFAEWASFDSLWTVDGAMRTVGFRLSVGGRHAATGTLRFDDDGLLRERTQTVHFEEGDMTVTEKYERMDLYP